MHPDTTWMLYQARESDRRRQLQQQKFKRLLHRSRLPQQIALWSGKHLFHLAIWLLRYGQPAMETRSEQQAAWATR